MGIYETFLYQPIFNALVFLYNNIPGNDVGLAIIVLTVIIKLVLFPFSLQSLKSQKALQSLQPKLDELKKKHKDNKEAMTKEMMELYKKEKVNPFSSCLPLLIQLPFLIAVYQVFRSGLTSDNFELLYPFVANPGHINSMFLGFMDLSQPSIYLAVLTAAVQFWQSKMMMAKRPPQKLRDKKGAKDEDMAAVMNKQMLYFMPIITIIIGASLPSGLILYWFITTLLTVAQQFYFLRDKKSEEKTEEKSEV